MAFKALIACGESFIPAVIEAKEVKVGIEVNKNIVSE
jgi:hypothetical protein